MTTNARKTDAQRLGNGKKAFNVKQVEKMVEDAGGSYTAGTGIVISNDEISVDGQTVAMKSELPDMNDYQPKLTAGDNITINENNVISAIGGGEWSVVDSTDWSGFIENNVLKEDLIIMRTNNNSNSKCVGTIFLPKGLTITNFEIDFPIYNLNDKGYGFDRVQLSSVFTSNSYVSYNRRSDSVSYNTTSRKLSFSFGENYEFSYTKNTIMTPNEGIILFRRN